MSLGKPPRLTEVFQKYDPPVYFVTLCTNDRRKTLANAAVCSAAIEYGRRGLERGFVLSRYVIMPDHIHLFITGADDFNLGVWVRGLKRVVAAAVSGVRGGLWQRGFFDHLIRSSESYSEKWNYVRDNPVRAGLASHAEEWPYQSEIVWIDRA
jgi:REP element-mobilizing transposase RayT